MSFYGSEEHEPVTWVRGHPVYAAHIVVSVFVASVVMAAILRFAHADTILTWGIFSSAAVLRGEVWRILTYGLVNIPTQASVLWFAIDMVMLYWFGREVEKAFGRTKFFALFAGTYLIPPLLFTALGHWMPAEFAGERASFSMFIAFATLYPGVPMLFNILAKWAAIILVAIYSLVALADHDWESLLMLWSTTGFAYAFVRHEQGHFTLPSLKLKRRPEAIRVRTTTAARTPPAPAKEPVAVSASMAEVDALLDKIAQHGIHSLTAKERARLDAARQELKNRSGR
jgi:hypothetical protein